jgi:hypothetical protein
MTNFKNYDYMEIDFKVNFDITPEDITKRYIVNPIGYDYSEKNVQFGEDKNEY